MALDKKVAFVLKKLEEDGLAATTVVIFMGDHGRAMVRGKQWPYDSVAGARPGSREIARGARHLDRGDK